MADSLNTQIQKLNKQIAEKQEKLKELESRKNDPSRTTHYKVVLGGDCVAAGIRIGSKDRAGHNAFIKYLKEHLDEINKIFEK